MKQIIGNKASEIILPSINGENFNTAEFKGKKYLLSFYRFAGCPLCNLRLHELITQKKLFKNKLNIVAIFDSPIDNLIYHTKGHNSCFPILADKKNIYYKIFGIEHSIKGVLTGMIIHFPRIIKGLFKGYIPSTLKGSITTMPADFLIDESGIIQKIHYGKNEGDHIDFKVISAFFELN